MVFVSVPVATALIGTTLAAIWDLKTTEVPDQIPYAMIAIALLFYGYSSFVEGTFQPLISSLIFGFAFLIFGGVMYYAGQWGGADAFLLAAIGFLLPATPIGSAQTLFAFPLSYFINIFIVGAAWMLVYAVFFSFGNKKVVTEFLKEVKSTIIGLMSVLIAASVTIYLIVTEVMKMSNLLGYDSALPFIIYSTFIAASTLIIWKFVKAVEVYGFRQRIPISKLKVGDMLQSEKKLIGMTKQQIASLKRSGKRFVDIKTGVPFALAFPVALLVTLLYGDLILFFINLF